jgi:hypothetical protein
VSRSALPHTARESTLVAGILRAANATLGVRLVKHHGSPYTARGHPDLYGVAYGTPIFLEVKTATGRLTPHQERELRRWGEVGACTATVRSVEEALAAIDMCRKGYSPGS